MTIPDGDIFAQDPYRSGVINFVIAKQVKPEFHNILLRGIGCNWLVCIALYLSAQAKDVASKVIGVWFPIFAFVILGFDHVVANMFFIPLGIWLHTPGLDVGLYIWKGIIPTTIGNVIGGAVFVGAYYWWMYLAFEPPVAVDGVVFQERESGGAEREASARWYGSDHSTRVGSGEQV